MVLESHVKQLIEDKEFASDTHNEDLSKIVLRRVFAVGKTFVNVSFMQSEISECYFRNCRFIRCDFTGANFRRSNLRGSQYEECKFRYSTWEHTQLDEEFLDSCLPSEENLARDLVRSLRVNFGHIGNAAAVNKAAAIEVKQTGLHLYLAAYSRQSYYRSKYKGWARVRHGIRHLHWKVLDLIWGNGESIGRVLVFGVSTVCLSSGYLAWSTPRLSAWQAICTVVYAFWGVDPSPIVPDHHLLFLTISRFVLFGLFMAILVKRLAQR